MKTELMNITPELAKLFLSKNSDGNRNVRIMRVKEYAEAMKRGEWQLNPEGISFYENGTLRDGQHRLHAIIRSGMTIPMYVTTDVPNESIICDRGSVRKAGDIIRMSGNAEVSGNSPAGAINYLLKMGSSNEKLKPSDASLIAFASDHGEAIKDAYNMCRAGRSSAICQKAPVIAAAFCAMKCGVDENTLRRFFTIANTGFYDMASETAAITLRNYLLGKSTGGSIVQKQIFTVTLQAIADFERCVPRSRAYKADAEPHAYWKRTKAYILSKYVR